MDILIETNPDTESVDLRLQDELIERHHMNGFRSGFIAGAGAMFLVGVVALNVMFAAI